MIRKISAEEFDRAYAIMEESFPTGEYREYGRQRALLDREDYYILGYFDGENLEGILATYELDGVTFYEHLAVTLGCRNRGYGHLLLDEGVRIAREKVVLEVELPDTDTSARRIAFYERNGFFLNRYDYTQPSIREGENEVELFVMSYGDSLTEEEFFAVKERIYADVYGVG